MAKSLSTEKHLSATFVKKVAESGASPRFVNSLIEHISEDELSAHWNEPWLVDARNFSKSKR